MAFLIPLFSHPLIVGLPLRLAVALNIAYSYENPSIYVFSWVSVYFFYALFSFP